PTLYLLVVHSSRHGAPLDLHSFLHDALPIYANNEAATPISNPTIKNLTLIGNNGGSENHAIKLRVGTKGSFDNVVLKNWGTGFDVQAAPDLSAGYVGTELKATNVKFENVTTTANATATGIYTENANATGAGNGTNTPAWAAGWTVGL